MCGLLDVEDEAIVDAGNTGNAKLLRLRADLDEESMERVEKLFEEVRRASLDEESAKTVDALLLAKGAENARQLRRVAAEKEAEVSRLTAMFEHAGEVQCQYAGKGDFTSVFMELKQVSLAHSSPVEIVCF